MQAENRDRTSLLRFVHFQYRTSFTIGRSKNHTNLYVGVRTLMVFIQKFSSNTFPYVLGVPTRVLFTLDVTGRTCPYVVGVPTPNSLHMHFSGRTCTYVVVCAYICAFYIDVLVDILTCTSWLCAHPYFLHRRFSGYTYPYVVVVPTFVLFKKAFSCTHLSVRRDQTHTVYIGLGMVEDKQKETKKFFTHSPVCFLERT